MRDSVRVAVVLTCVGLFCAGMYLLSFISLSRARTEGTTGVVYQACDCGESRIAFLRNGDVVLLDEDGEAMRAGMRRFDRILAIDGIPITDGRRLRRNAAARRTNDTVIYTVQRGSAIFPVPVRLRPPDTSLTYALWFTAPFFLLVGGFVYARRPRDEAAKALLAFCTVSMAGVLLGPLSLTLISGRGLTPLNDIPPEALALSIVAGAFSLTAVAALAHLALVFPRRTAAVVRHPALPAWLYIAPILGLTMGVPPIVYHRIDAGTERPLSIVLGLLAIAGWLLLRRKSRAPGTAPAGHPVLFSICAHLELGQLYWFVWVAGGKAGLIYLVFSLTGLVLVSILIPLFGYPLAAGLIVLGRYRTLGYEERRQLQWPLLGIAAAIGGMVAANAAGVWVLAGGWSRAGEWLITLISAVALLVVPLSFAFAILKYRLFDIEIIVRKAALYGVLSFLLGAVYLAVSAAATLFLVRAMEVRGETVSILSTVCVAALFVPTRNRVQRYLEARFFRQRQAYPAALQAVARVLSEHASDWPQRVCEEVQRATEARTVALLRAEPQSRSHRVLATLGLPDEARQAVVEDVRPDRALRVAEAALFPAQESSLLRAMLIVFSESPREVFGCLTVGRRLSSEPYEEHDRQFLVAVANQLASTFETERWKDLTSAAEQWRQLDRISRLVFASLVRTGEPAPRSSLEQSLLASLSAEGIVGSRERIAEAIDRLIARHALSVDGDGTIHVTRRDWLLLPDLQRPIEELVREGRERIGGFEIIERIGAGGMGEVFRALNVHDGTIAALKLLPPSDQGQEEARRRLEREGAIVAAISHPNVVRLQARGEHEGRLFLAMDYVDGETLSAIIRRAPLAPDGALRVAVQIAMALAELHRRGVVHRDLKASNVMVTRNGRAVLLDFGLARASDSSTLTKSQAILGTLPYMSPEQLRGDTTDAATDVWSLGILLYEMLTGCFPWSAREPLRLAVEILAGQPDLTAVDSSIRPFLEDLLRADRNQRLADGTAVLERLRAFAELPIADSAAEFQTVRISPP